MGQLLRLSLALEAFLEQQPLNIAVVRCQGACRAGQLVLAAYLLVKARCALLRCAVPCTIWHGVASVLKCSQPTALAVRGSLRWPPACSVQ